MPLLSLISDAFLNLPSVCEFRIVNHIISLKRYAIFST